MPTTEYRELVCIVIRAKKEDTCVIIWLIEVIGLDTGYPHDGHADKDSYPHDGRADKDSYPHDGPADRILIRTTGITNTLC